MTTPRDRLALTMVQIACLLLAWAFLHHINAVLGPLDREFANDAAQQQRHLERVERQFPGATQRVIDAGGR